MSITRLSGGLTPASGADPRTFPTIFNEAADVIDDLGVGFRLVGTRYYTSSGTFDKADPFGDGSFDGALMRAIRVKVQGAGGGSGGAATANRTSAGGGGGAYAEKLVTDIAGLSTSESVTVGAGGTAGADTDGAGGNGGNSEAFGVIAGGGTGGNASSGAFGEMAGGTATGADFSITGGEGGTRSAGVGTTVFSTSIGGSAHLGNVAAQRPGAANQAGRQGFGFGVGANGAMFVSTTAQSGGPGRPGVVIVEVFA
jgi:hypothetical protein